MVRAVRTGQSMRSVSKQYGVSLSTVQLWVLRAEGKALEQVNWSDESHTPHCHPNQTDASVRERLIAARKYLAQMSDLGEYGGQAIRDYLIEQGDFTVPSVPTINRILRAAGVFDRQVRVRRKPPIRGWYLPEVASGQSDIDETDFVEALFLEGEKEHFVLNTISLHGGLCASRICPSQRTDFVLESLLSHWRSFGLPNYAQFDNGNVFTGPRQHPDTIGRVIRLCLSLGVNPVFSAPTAFGFQSAIESYNGRWREKAWKRFVFTSFEEAQSYSDRYVAAANRKSKMRQAVAPPRRAFPMDWKEPTKLDRTGKIIFIRMTNNKGEVEILTRNYPVAEHWCSRLVRCEVDLVENKVRVYALRRAATESQPLLQEWAYKLPDKRKKMIKEEG